MKKLLLLAIFGFALSFSGRAQYVTIPDITFAGWLRANGYAGCMNSNQLDTTCTQVQNATGIFCSGIPIVSLEGIEYFRNLDSLDCSSTSVTTLPVITSGSFTYLNVNNDHLNTLPAWVTTSNLQTLLATSAALNSISAFPPNLVYFDCSANLVQSLPALPVNLLHLACSSNSISVIPALPAGLQFLDCSVGSCTSLPALPGNLDTLICGTGPLSVLPALPASLVYLDCTFDRLTALPALPTALQTLYCGANNITALPALPTSLITFTCLDNQLSVIPALSQATNLTYLNCSGNPLTSPLPALPNSLQYLYCESDFLNVLPMLPASLYFVDCSFNNLQTLPINNTVHLSELYCSHNRLTALPTFNVTSLHYFDCSSNQLTSIPDLNPTGMVSFFCGNNPQLTCLPRLYAIDTLNFEGTAVACLPDYGQVFASAPKLASLPVCGVYNPNSCPVYQNITGRTYYDANSNCLYDAGDVLQGNVKAQLYKSGVLQQTTFSGGEGLYSFQVSANYGAYAVQVDTSQLPFTVECPQPAYYTDSVLTADSIFGNNNFALKCRTSGFDVGVWNVINVNDARPNSPVQVNVTAGDISQIFGAHCAAGVSGQVSITINGPAVFAAPAAGALTPTTATSNALTWNIADFGAVNDSTAFNIILATNPYAHGGDNVCITVTVTPATGDYNLQNNTATYCFPLLDALDPNEKQVYPSGVIDTSQTWLTYTIRFENTGTDTAFNVYVLDTLSNSLDVSSFQLLASSATANTQLIGNILRFNFPNVDLMDSLDALLNTGNDLLSQGYVQYKIKLKRGLPVGTIINNTASIYFDLNSPVITNTAGDTLGTCAPNSSFFIDTICFGDTLHFAGYAYTHTGYYTPTLTNVAGCDSVAALTLTVNQTTLTTYCIGGDQGGPCFGAALLIAGGINYDSVKWELNGVVLKGATGDTIPFTDGYGPFYFLGFSDTIPLFVTQIVCFTGYNSCGVFTACDSFSLWSEGISTIPGTNLFSFHPNPADDYTIISFDASYTGATIFVKDITGRQLYQTQLTTNPQQIPTGNLPPGVYLVTIFSNGEIGAKLLVKE